MLDVLSSFLSLCLKIFLAGLVLIPGDVTSITWAAWLQACTPHLPAQQFSKRVSLVLTWVPKEEGDPGVRGDHCPVALRCPCLKGPGWKRRGCWPACYRHDVEGGEGGNVVFPQGRELSFLLGFTHFLIWWFWLWTPGRNVLSSQCSAVSLGRGRSFSNGIGSPICPHPFHGCFSSLLHIWKK